MSRPVDPPVPAAVQRVRLALATAAGRAAAWASRTTGRGSGASIQGKVLLTLDPGALSTLLAGRRTAVVTGTNGKTTTSHLLTAALRQGSGEQVVTNADGANLHHGIASALSNAPRAKVAVLETDERVVPTIVRIGQPEVLVLLNFSRDQMDRNHEIKSLGRGWRTALTEAGEAGPVVVANACDPLVVWSAQPAHRTVWVDTGTGWLEDATLCPGCGTVLTHRENGHWDCPGCELTQPEADYRVDGEVVTGPEGEQWTLELQVPGRFNRSNAACALAAAREMGMDAQQALAGFATVTSPAGRFAIATFGEVKARLLLAKNPAGWAESLPLATSDPVVLAINALAADGRDVSWLYDVNYEQLAGRRVIVTGPRANDLATRLLYAGVDHVVETDLARALARPEVKAHDGVVDVISTYTPFQQLRRLGGLA